MICKTQMKELTVRQLIEYLQQANIPNHKISVCGVPTYFLYQDDLKGTLLIDTEDDLDSTEE